MKAEPGLIRVRGSGRPFLAGMDIHVEALQTDGTWLPLRDVCYATVTIAADDLVRARLELLVSEIDLSGITPDAVAWIDHRSRWQRFVSWLRGRPS